MASRVFVLILLLAIALAVDAADRDESWTFTSLYGQEITLAQDAEGFYTISVADLTERRKACDPESYRVCFSSALISAAIPRELPKPHSSWTVGPARFSMLAVVEEVKILGSGFRDLYVVDVQREAVPPIDPISRRFRLFFTYDEGLVAFAIQDEHGQFVSYIASRVPSLGAE